MSTVRDQLCGIPHRYTQCGNACVVDNKTISLCCHHSAGRTDKKHKRVEGKVVKRYRLLVLYSVEYAKCWVSIATTASNSAITITQ